MTTPLKGEAPFTVEGKAYTLHFSTDALVSVETVLDRGITEIAMVILGWQKNPAAMRLGYVRALLWAGLRDNHPDVDLTAAGEMIKAAGGMFKVLPHINAAMASAFPQPETAGPHPREPRRPNRAARRRAKSTGSAS